MLGTTDFSLCEISDGMIEVLASNGDVFLGGSDWDNAIASWIKNAIAEEYGVDVSGDAQAMQRILEASEAAKIDLSSVASTDINLPYISLANGSPVHFVKSLSRAKMEQLTSNLVDKVIACGKKAVTDAKVDYNEIDSILMVGGQSRSLAIREALTNEFKKELNLSVNPDECVASGAAVQASIICGLEGSKEMLLLDVTPISMGIETMGGVFTKLIEANTTIPCKKTEVFSTAVDNQSSVDINVLQGERPMAKDNKSIGLFRLDGIMPAPRGIPQIVVNFDINANGILTVTAVDKATGKEQSITIQSKGSLSDAEIEKIKREAEQFAEADKKEREIADTINKGDALAFSNEKMIKEHAEKLTEDEKTSLNELVEKMKKAVTDKSVDDINNLEKEINDKWNVISTRMYSAQQTTTEQPQSEPTSTDGDNIKDATFEEVK